MCLYVAPLPQPNWALVHTQETLPNIGKMGALKNSVNFITQNLVFESIKTKAAESIFAPNVTFITYSSTYISSGLYF